MKSAYHPSGSKCLNTMLWKHFKLARAAQFNEWSLCALCEQEKIITLISRVDGSTSNMMKYLIDEQNLYVKYFIPYTGYAVMCAWGSAASQLLYA